MAWRLLFVFTFFFICFGEFSSLFASSPGSSLTGLQSEEDKKIKPSIKAPKKDSASTTGLESNKKKSSKSRNRHKKKLTSNENSPQHPVEEKTSIEILPKVFSINPQSTGPIHKDKEEIQPESLLPLLSQNLAAPQDNLKKKKKSKAISVSPQNVKSQVDQLEEAVLSQQSALYFSKDLSEKTILTVEKLIQKIIQEKREESLKVNVSLNREDITSFHEAFTTLVKKYPFPFTWSIFNKGLSNPKDEKSPSTLELSLSSLAKERERVEKSFVYQVSQEEEKNVNWPFVFDAAMRSDFTLEDFKFNNSIKVRMIEFQGDIEEKILDEFQQFLQQKLPKDNNPFHILGINLRKKGMLAQGKMLDGFLRKISEHNVSLRHRGIVCDSQSDSLYLCLDNTHRRLLDLHGGRSVKEAGRETEDFIISAYEIFKEDVTVLTGRGNHVNNNGQKGVLREAFKKDWVKDKFLSSIIKNHFPINGEGGYKIIFKKIQALDLKNKKQEELLPFLSQTITEMVQKKKARLRVILNNQAPVLGQNAEFKLLMGVFGDIRANNSQLLKSILPLSFEATPGDLKIIFNKEHPENPSSFTFGNSYGSPNIFGTLR